MLPPDGTTGNPLADVVAQQYERWVYPEPIMDLPAWLEHNWQWFDPSHAHRLLWPDRDYRADLDILVAGCGTNQAAVLAYTNPRARVVAVDVSQSSLQHHAFLRSTYSLDNLELHQLPIEDLHTLDRNFDLIVSTGVLHHLADPAAGMRALADCLRRDGVIAAMLYAAYGRIGVEILQGVFRDLGLRQDEASLRIVRDALASVPAEHPIASYLPLADDLSVDAGMVDTFLHGRDRSFTVPECLELVETAGLAFQGWLLKSPYYPPLPPGNSFYEAVSALPLADQWAVMERVNSRNACHFFMACHPERPASTYDIDFASPRWADYVPSLRYRVVLAGPRLARHDWAITLDPIDLAVVRRIDGLRTMRQVIDAAARDEGRAPAELEEGARGLVQSLWQRDFLAMGIVDGAAA